MDKVLVIILIAVVVVVMMVKASGQSVDQTTAHENLVQGLRSKGIHDERVLDAVARVPRHRFVPDRLQHLAYADRALPIGEGQTISQPYVVASMTEMLHIDETSKVLEIGTGSGYQAAVLSVLVNEVYSIEIVEPLGRRSAALLTELGYQNVHVRIGDGYQGWPEQAPFDAIIVTAAPDHIPQPLIEQLAVGGRMVLPVGDSRQFITLVERTETDVEITRDLPVLFVPMTGEAQTH